MRKTILITGATDGIGLEAARMLVTGGHHVLIHGRNAAKLERVERDLSSLAGDGRVEPCLADLSSMTEVEALAASVSGRHATLDVLINNAGVYRTDNPVVQGGLDVRFVVNTIAPYLLTHRLLPLLGRNARVLNLSSAAQSPVDLQALRGDRQLPDGAAYAQSKLALTMWSRALALARKEDGPAVIAINPGSMLGTKMVKDAFGVSGGDIGIGAEILTRAALSEDFADASGQYFDNDKGRFAPPHPDALDDEKCRDVVRAVEQILSRRTPLLSRSTP